MVARTSYRIGRVQVEIAEAMLTFISMYTTFKYIFRPQEPAD